MIKKASRCRKGDRLILCVTTGNNLCGQDLNIDDGEHSTASGLFVDHEVINRRRGDHLFSKRGDETEIAEMAVI